MNGHSLLTVIEFIKFTGKLSNIYFVIMIDFWHEVDQYLENFQNSANYHHFSPGSEQNNPGFKHFSFSWYGYDKQDQN